MTRQFVRRAAVAGSWYPARAAALTGEVTRYLGAVDRTLAGDVLAIIAPHAGLMYSGPVAAYAYRAAEGRRFDVAVLVGPSHFVPFRGVSIVERGAFATPLGDVAIAEDIAAAIRSASAIVHPYEDAHANEHSLEMQLPFLRTVLPETPIVPLLMGYQTRETILGLADALARALAGRRTLLVASTDLSHYLDAATANRLDARVLEHVGRFDADGLLAEFERYPEHERGQYVACGGGPAISVMHAARALGAADAAVLKYADSGDVSGDKSQVVGYMAAALGRFSSH